MADQNINLKQSVSPKVLQRTLLLGRVKMAQAIKMPENEWAKLLSEVEKDPLFQDLFSAHVGRKQVIKYRPHRKTGISGQFYEMQDATVVEGSGIELDALLAQKKNLLSLIEKVGQDKFEQHFLYREEATSTEDIANECGISLEEANQIQEFILQMSVQSEFYHPSGIKASDLTRPTLVGRIIKNDDGSYSMSFFSPHMARGQYDINHDALKKWQKDKKLNKQEAGKVRKYVGLLELSNLKQGAFWRVMEYLLVLHKDYFDTKDESKMAPVSLRKIARHLQFAPSTISRVMSNKSVLLPWDKEILITDLMPGQRKVVLLLLEEILNGLTKPMTDSQLAKLLAEKYDVRVSRRTVTACRHLLASKQKIKPE